MDMAPRAPFIAYDNLFSTWIEPKSDFDESNARDVLPAFSWLFKKLFDGVRRRPLTRAFQWI